MLVQASPSGHRSEASSSRHWLETAAESQEWMTRYVDRPVDIDRIPSSSQLLIFPGRKAAQKAPSVAQAQSAFKPSLRDRDVSYWDAGWMIGGDDEDEEQTASETEDDYLTQRRTSSASQESRRGKSSSQAAWPELASDKLFAPAHDRPVRPAVLPPDVFSRSSPDAFDEAPAVTPAPRRRRHHRATSAPVKDSPIAPAAEGLHVDTILPINLPPLHLCAERSPLSYPVSWWDSPAGLAASGKSGASSAPSSIRIPSKAASSRPAIPFDVADRPKAAVLRPSSSESDGSMHGDAGDEEPEEQLARGIVRLRDERRRKAAIAAAGPKTPTRSKASPVTDDDAEERQIRQHAGLVVSNLADVMLGFPGYVVDGVSKAAPRRRSDTVGASQLAPLSSSPGARIRSSSADAIHAQQGSATGSFGAEGRRLALTREQREQNGGRLSTAAGLHAEGKAIRSEGRRLRQERRQSMSSAEQSVEASASSSTGIVTTLSNWLWAGLGSLATATLAEDEEERSDEEGGTPDSSAQPAVFDVDRELASMPSTARTSMLSLPSLLSASASVASLSSLAAHSSSRRPSSASEDESLATDSDSDEPSLSAAPRRSPSAFGLSGAWVDDATSSFFGDEGAWSHHDHTHDGLTFASKRSASPRNLPTPSRARKSILRRNGQIRLSLTPLDDAVATTDSSTGSSISNGDVAPSSRSKRVNHPVSPLWDADPHADCDPTPYQRSWSSVFNL